MKSEVRYRARRSSSNKINGSTILKVTEKRSKQGCITCRRRKKKCDEKKPICSACKRNFLQCIWFGDEKAEEEPSRCVNAEPTSFSNLTVHDLSDVYSWSTRKAPRYKKQKKDISHAFITLSTKNGQLKLKKNGKKCFETTEFPTVEQLGDIEEKLSTESGLMIGKTFGTDIEKGQKSISEILTTPAYKDFFDMQWEPNQIFEKSDFAFNWFTRFDNLEEQFCNDRNHGEHRPPNKEVTSGYENPDQELLNGEREKLGDGKKFYYNYLYDKDDPLAKKYNGIMNGFDQGDFSMLKQISTDEHFLIYACVHRWLPKMGPQDTHPLLTTAATFTSHFESNYVVKEVFLCCGATYLEWYEYEIFSELSNGLYKSSLALIEKYLKENSFHGTEAWLLASYQLLCLRNKTTSNTTVDDCIYCLSKSYRIIKATYYVSEDVITNQSRENHDSKFLYQYTTEQVHELTYEIENTVLQIEEQIDNVKNHLILQPHERMFIESFIYNYSVAILWSSDISKLPNPFTFFKEINHLLRCPIYHCELQWMNNPILGAASDGFEILAKVSYLTRLPMPLPREGIWMKRCQRLLKMSQFYTSPIIIPRSNDKNSKINESCVLNIYVAKIIAKVCYLLLCKIIRYETYSISEAQPIVDEVIEIMEKIPEKHLMWGILLWPVTICGIFVVKPTHQSKVLKHLNDIGELLHKTSVLNSIFFLKTIWSKPADAGRLDVIFDKKQLIKVNP